MEIFKGSFQHRTSEYNEIVSFKMFPVEGNQRPETNNKGLMGIGLPHLNVTKIIRYIIIIIIYFIL